MKILKWIGIIIVLLIAAFLIFSAIQPNQVLVSKSIEIEASPERVYKQLIELESWGDWSVWSQKDPNMVTTISGVNGTVGSKSEWKSTHPEVGNGSQEFVEVRENEYLKQEMFFEFTGWETPHYAEFILEQVGDGNTKLTWTFEGAKTPFYANLMNTMIKPELEKSYVTSLNNLKTLIEENVEIPNPMNLEILEVEAVKIISIRDTTTSEGISDKLLELYTELAIYMGAHEEIERNGMPIGIYHYYSEDRVDLEAAFPISGDAVSEGRVVVGATPAGKVLKGLHLGDYNASGNIHMAMEKYVELNDKIEFHGVCWEVYANDPEEVDSADVRTEIYYSLR